MMSNIHCTTFRILQLFATRNIIIDRRHFCSDHKIKVYVVALLDKDK